MWRRVAEILPKGQFQLRNAAASRLRQSLLKQETREPCSRADDRQITQFGVALGLGHEFQASGVLQYSYRLCAREPEHRE
jgi:hypothetical protein